MLGADVPAARARRLGEPPPAARDLHELDDARRRRPGAGRDPRGPADLARRGVRARRSRPHVAPAHACRASRSASASPTPSRRSTRWSSARPRTRRDYAHPLVGCRAGGTAGRCGNERQLGQHASAGGPCCAREAPRPSSSTAAPMPSASAGPRFAELPLHARRRLRRPDARRDRAVDAPGARPAQRRRARRRRPTASASRSRRTRSFRRIVHRGHTRRRARGGPHGPRRGHAASSRSATTGTASSPSGTISPVGRFRTAPRYGTVPEQPDASPTSRARTTRTATSRPSRTSRGRRTSSSSCISATTSTRARAWSTGPRAHAPAGIADDARGVPHAARPVQDRPGAPGRPRRRSRG